MIILNGSPKANINESNTQIFINEFQRDMKQKYPVKYIVREDYEQLANSLKDYDTILIFLPLYIHAMPGHVMKFIEKLDVSIMRGKKLGFFIQAGFPETAQEQFVVDYFEQLSNELKCDYLGTVCKGDAAGTYMFPDKFKKLYKLLNKLGGNFEVTKKFDENISHELSHPYNLSDYSKLFQILLKLTYKLKLCDMGWNMMLKRNKSFDNRFDKPFDRV